MTPADLNLLLMDWATYNKATDAAASGVLHLLRAAVSKEDAAHLETWDQLKNKLRKFEGDVVQRIDVCINDCIAYYDSKNLPKKEQWRHYHRTVCPACNEPRYVIDPETNSQKPRKVMFHFFLAPFVRSLYARLDVAEQLPSDSGARPESHVSWSRGFKAKVTDNPQMNGDIRNLAFIGSTDGVPLFDDQRRSAWPFLLRVANLPDSMAQHPSNAHLALLAPGEHLTLDTQANCVRRVFREPKSLKPYTHVLVDDLYGAYHNGIPVKDSRCSDEDANANFMCKCALLYWVGDYPAQAKISGMHIYFTNISALIL